MMLPMLVGGATMGVVAPVMNRLMQRYFPTPLEKLQMESQRENMRIARERLILDQKRPEELRQQQREQFQHANSMQSRQFNHDYDIRNHAKRLDIWPYTVAAIDIINASARSPKKSLNVLIVNNCVGEEACFKKAAQSAFASLDKSHRQLFNSDNFLYLLYSRNYLAKSPPPPLSGQSLVTTVNSALHTEPTALIEIRQHDEQTISFDIARWRWIAAEEGGHAVKINSPYLLAVDANEADAAQDIEAALLTLIAGLGDAYDMIRLTDWETPPKPQMFQAMAALQGIRLYQEARTKPGHIERVYQENLLIHSYTKTLGDMAQYAPAFASEVAAQAALSAHEAGYADNAEKFLAESLDFYRAAVRNAPLDDAGLIDLFQQSQRRTLMSTLSSALHQIRNIDQNQPPAHGKGALKGILSSVSTSI